MMMIEARLLGVIGTSPARRRVSGRSARHTGGSGADGGRTRGSPRRCAGQARGGGDEDGAGAGGGGAGGGGGGGEGEGGGGGAGEVEAGAGLPGKVIREAEVFEVG